MKLAAPAHVGLRGARNRPAGVTRGKSEPRTQRRREASALRAQRISPTLVVAHRPPTRQTPDHLAIGPCGRDRGASATGRRAVMQSASKSRSAVHLTTPPRSVEGSNEHRHRECARSGARGGRGRGPANPPRSRGTPCPVPSQRRREPADGPRGAFREVDGTSSPTVLPDSRDQVRSYTWESACAVTDSCQAGCSASAR